MEAVLADPLGWAGVFAGCGEPGDPRMLPTSRVAVPGRPTTVEEIEHLAHGGKLAVEGGCVRNDFHRANGTG
jgi:hypothetical protein